MEGVHIQIMAQNISHLHEVGLKHWLNISNLVLLNIHREDCTHGRRQEIGVDISWTIYL